MKYIKTYESFNVNETLDMFTLPVDPITGAAGVYKEIANFIKTKMTDLVKYLGDKLNLFIEKLSSLCDSIVDEIGSGANKVLENIKKGFGYATDGTSLASLNYDKVREIIESKFKVQIESGVKSNEGYYWEPSSDVKKEIHREQESGEGNAVTSLPKDSGIVQTILAVLQNIFGVNLYACGVPLALLISILFGAMGMTAVVAMLASFAISAIALLVIIVARKLVYNLEHGA